MTVADMCRISGYSRQRLNQIAKLYQPPCFRRKPNGRLEILDEVIVRKWCEKLRRRKEQRRQRNEDRKMQRSRRAFWREIGEIMQEGIRKALPDLIREMNAKFEEKIPDGIEDAWNEYVRDLSRRVLQERSKVLEVQRDAFAYRGRKRSTGGARYALWDFAINSIDQYKSYAAIARDFGCTRAALSAAAKSLPNGLVKRSGRSLRKRP